MAQIDEQRLMTKVARYYYENGMRQSEIAEKLGLSQATISRLFNRARDEGIVRITVNVPNGVNDDLEQAIADRYGLKDVIIVDCLDDENIENLNRDLGSVAAFYVESTVKDGEVIGLSSWSSTLLAMVDAMNPVKRKKDIHVVQILGGVGNPGAEVYAARLTGRFADLVGGTAVFLPVPGIVGSAKALEVFLAESYVQEAMSYFPKMSLALVGIGAVEPSPLLATSGNVFSKDELALLRRENAVGDVLLRFFNDDGVPIEGALEKQVVSMELEQLKKIDRAVGIAGGKKKYTAIRGALRGGWINVLITDKCTAEWLLANADET